MSAFIVTHETIVLDTNFEKCQLSGFVELTVSLQKEYFYIKQAYHDANFNRISINLPVIDSDSFTIHEVTVDEYSAKYEQRQPCLRRINNNFSHIADLHSFETLFLSNVADVMDYGELMITIPHELLKKLDSSPPEPSHKKQKLCNGHHVQKTDWTQCLLEPLIIKIAFTAKEATDGIHWVVPRNSNGTPSTTPSPSSTDTNSRENSVNSPSKSSSYKPKMRSRCFGEMEYCETIDEQKKNEIMFPHRKCHMYSYNAHWIPCLNRLKHRCTYTLQISVPMDYVAICSGDLKVSKSNASSAKTIFIYDINHAVSARNLMFAVGPFQEIILNDILPDVATALSPGMMNMHHMDIDDDDDDDDEEDDDEDMIKKEMMDSDEEDIDNEESVCIKLYVLDAHSTEDVIATCFNMERILKVYSNFLELSFPFKTLSFVFVDEAYETGSAYLNLNILSSDLIHNELEIEASYATNEVLSRCIADNWMSYALDVHHVQDLWIKIGFAGLLHEEWLSIFEGKNEIEYRKAIWRNHREENGPHPHHAPKPPLFWNGYLHEQQLYVTYYPFVKEKSMFVMIMLQQLIGSQSFKRNVTNHILFTPQVHHNKKQKFVSEYGTKITTQTLETHLCGIYSEKQIKTFFRHFIYGDCCPKICAEYTLKTKDKRHTLCIKQEASHDAYCNVIGTLKIQIQELEHELIEYVEIPGDDTMKFEFVCQSRAKRKHKNGDNEPWLEAPANNDTPVKLIRIDPDYEMLLHLVFFIVEPKIAITQLLHDDIRDVKSQIEAIYSLRFVPSKDVSLALLQTLNDEMNFYKVRLEAAKALAEDRNPDTLHENKTELMNIIKKLWHNMTHIKYHNKRTDENKAEQVVNYFLIKHIIGYLSTLLQHKYPHYTPIEVVELILTLLKQLIDDNLSEFPFSTQQLTASMIENLGNIRVADQKHNKLDEIVDLLSQILSLQRLFQSAAGIVRCACLKTFAKLHLNHKYHRKLDEIVTRKIKPFAKYGKFHDNVRLTAFQIMVTLIKDCKSKNIKRCLNIIANERVPGVKLKMIQIWAQNNENSDYFDEYQRIATELHTDHHNTIQSLVTSNSNSLEPDADAALLQREENEQREEKLDAINLRPTLRGTTKLTASSFLNDVLRNKTPLNQMFVAQTIWNLLLKSLDKRQYENYQVNQIVLHDDGIAARSIDLIFALYQLYKSIWAFNEPPFFKQKSATLYANEIGNQKRVHDAVQKLKADFNNNRPMFCSFGAQFWRCT